MLVLMFVSFENFASCALLCAVSCCSIEVGAGPGPGVGLGLELELELDLGLWGRGTKDRGRRFESWFLRARRTDAGVFSSISSSSLSLWSVWPASVTALRRDRERACCDLTLRLELL